MRRKTKNHTRNKKWELIINMDEEVFGATIAPIIGIVLFFLLCGGCSTNKQETEYQLLHYQDNHVKKEIDIKEILKKDFC